LTVPGFITDHQERIYIRLRLPQRRKKKKEEKREGKKETCRSGKAKGGCNIRREGKKEGLNTEGRNLQGGACV
jgi:hypothetical protein